MKIFFTLTVLFTCFVSVAQLPPNGNFESWGNFGEIYESPEFWFTSNTEQDTAVAKVTEAYEGDFAMEVNSMIPDVFQEGMAKVGFPMTESFTTVTAWVKAEIIGAAQVSIYVENYENDILMGFDSWFSNESIDDWQQITINVTEEIADSVVIVVLATGGDFAYGAATITVDAFWMDAGGNEVNQENVATPDLYYLTTSKSLHIDSHDLLIDLDIFDSSGKLIFSIPDPKSRINLTGVSSGIYIANLRTSKGVFSQKIVIQ